MRKVLHLFEPTLRAGPNSKHVESIKAAGKISEKMPGGGQRIRF